LLKNLQNGGKLKGNYRGLRDKIVALMPSTQTPNYHITGAVNPRYAARKPFTI